VAQEENTEPQGGSNSAQDVAAPARKRPAQQHLV
jgi:hypothetical protein